MSNKQHMFHGKEFFYRMKSAHLTKVKSELVQVANRMGENYVEEIGVQQEVSLSLISFLLRRCDELEYIKLNNVRFKLNSILHAHMVMHIDKGDILYRSDDDLKKEREGVKVDEKFISDLMTKVDCWLEEKL